MEEEYARIFGIVIINWVVVTLAMAIAFSVTANMVVIIGIATARMFRWLLIYLNVEAGKATESFRENVRVGVRK